MTDNADGVIATLRAAASWCAGKSAHGSDLGLLHVRDLVADLLSTDDEYKTAKANVPALHTTGSRYQRYLKAERLRNASIDAIRATRSPELPSHEDWVAALNPLMPYDFKDWHDNHPKDLPLVVAEVIKSLKERADG